MELQVLKQVLYGALRHITLTKTRLTLNISCPLDSEKSYREIEKMPLES